MTDPNSPQGGHGLFRGLRHFLASLIGVAETRLALLANELAEEKLRLGALLGTGLAALVLLSMGLLFGVVFLTVAFWEYRLWVLGLSALACLGLGALLVRAALTQASAGSRLFVASLAELRADIDALRGRRPD